MRNSGRQYAKVRMRISSNGDGRKEARQKSKIGYTGANETIDGVGIS